MGIKKVNIKYNTIILMLFICLIFSIVIFSTMGTANIKVLDTFKIIGSKLPLIGKKMDVTNISDSYKTIILNIRLPRVLLGVLVGASLASAGAAFQGLFKNPMADLYVIGISS